MYERKLASSVVRNAPRGERPRIPRTNAAGASWSLEIRDDGLWAGPDCPYGEQAIPVEVDGVVQVLWFGGEAYRRL